MPNSSATPDTYNGQHFGNTARAIVADSV